MGRWRSCSCPASHCGGAACCQKLNTNTFIYIYIYLATHIHAQACTQFKASIQIGAGKTIPTIRTISETIMRKRDNAILVRINWDDSDVPLDIRDRRCLPTSAYNPQLPPTAPPPPLFFFFLDCIDGSVCIGQMGALQVCCPCASVLALATLYQFVLSL